MPVSKGGRYRTVETSKGLVRLHFKPGKGGAVDEAVNVETGARHTPREFAADARRAAARAEKPTSKKG